jgi:hypothetical protein
VGVAALSASAKGKDEFFFFGSFHPPVYIAAPRALVPKSPLSNNITSFYKNVEKNGPLCGLMGGVNHCLTVIYTDVWRNSVV